MRHDDRGQAWPPHARRRSCSAYAPAPQSMPRGLGDPRSNAVASAAPGLRARRAARQQQPRAPARCRRDRRRRHRQPVRPRLRPRRRDRLRRRRRLGDRQQRRGERQPAAAGAGAALPHRQRATRTASSATTSSTSTTASATRRALPSDPGPRLAIDIRPSGNAPLDRVGPPASYGAVPPAYAAEPRPAVGEVPRGRLRMPSPPLPAPTTRRRRLLLAPYSAPYFVGPAIGFGLGYWVGRAWYGGSAGWHGGRGYRWR